MSKLEDNIQVCENIKKQDPRLYKDCFEKLHKTLSKIKEDRETEKSNA